MKHSFKRVCSFVLALCMIFSLLPVVSFAADGDVVAKIGTTEYTDLRTAIKAAASSGATVELTEGAVIELDNTDKDTHSNANGSLIYLGGGSFTINGNGATIKAVGSGMGYSVMKLSGGGNYVLKNLTIEVAGWSKQVLDVAQSTVELSNVTIVKGSYPYSITNNRGVITANSSNIGGGVEMAAKSGKDATYTMNGGTLGGVRWDNTAAGTTATVIVNDGGTITGNVTGSGSGDNVLIINDGEVTGSITADQVKGVSYDVVFTVDDQEYAKRTVAWGETVEAPADPAKEGYTFAGWLKSGKAFDVTTAIKADTTLAASFTAIEYTVTYADEEGNVLTEPAAVQVSYGSSVTVPTLDNKADAAFVGWAGSNGKVYLAGQTYTLDYAGDLNLRAVYDNDTQYATIRFMVDGSQYDAVMMQTNADNKYTVNAPADPSKEGYTFDGWTANGTDLVTFPAEAAAGTVYTAVFTPKQYTVNYKGENGEDIGIDSEKWTYGSTVKITQTQPDKDGAVFVGWMGNDGKIYVPGRNYVVDYAGTLTLRAVYDNDTQYANIPFVNDGSVYHVVNVTAELDGLYTIEAPADPSKEGYTFDGWTANGTDLVIFPAEAAAGTVYTAVFTPKQYTVNYKGENGEDIGIDSEKWTYGSTVKITQTQPDKDDAVFVGWQGNDGKIYVPGRNYVVDYAGTLTLRAVYDYDTQYANITFVNDGSVYHVVNVTAELDGLYTIEAPADPSKEGYKFEGWTENGTDLVTFPVEAADGTVYTAVYTANEYEVNYTDEAGNNVATETWVYGEKVEITVALDEKDNAKFLGWTGNDGKFYEVGRKYTVTYAGDLNLQAVYDYNNTYFLVYFYDTDGSIYATELMSRELDDNYQVTVPEYEPVAGAKWKISTGDVWYGTGEVVDIAEGTYFTVDLDTVVNDYVVAYNVDGTVDAARTEPAVSGVYNDVVEFTPTINSNERLLSVTVKGDKTGMTYACNETATAGTYAFTMPSEAVTVTVTVKTMADATITYVVDAGVTAPADQTVTWNTSFTAAEYTGSEKFICWQASDGRMMLPGQSYVATEDLTLTAVCESPDSPIYIVKYNYADGTLYNLQLATKENGYKVTTLDNPTVEGYTVTGWSNDTITYTDPTEIDVTGDMVLTLVAAPTSYNVYQKSEPVDDTSYTDVLATYGSEVVVDVAAIDGYVFDSITVVGASGKAYDVNPAIEGVKYTFSMPAEDVNVTVTYAEVPVGSCVINFYVDGELYDYAVVDQGTKLTNMPTEPTKEGSTFDGWTDGTTTYTSEVQTVKDQDTLRLDAVWTVNDYDVTFVANNGEADVTKADIPYNTTINTPAAPTKEGHVFIGWVAASTGFIYDAEVAYTVTADETFTAKWEKGEYIVRFLDQKNNTVAGYEVVEYNGKATAPAVEPTYPGLKFIGWKAGNDTVASGAQTSAITASVDYIAQWDVLTYAITTTGTNVTFEGLSKGTVNAGEAIAFTVTPTDGYAVKSVVLRYTNNEGILVNETIVADDNGEYKFSMPASNVQIIATAVQNKFLIFTRTDTNSNITGNPSSAEVGTPVEFKVTATDNYVVENVYVQGDKTGNKIPVSVIVNGTDKTYYFTMPEEDVTIFTTSVVGKYVVTYVDYDNTYLGSEPVNSGQTAVGITPVRNGYVFDGWNKLPENTAYEMSASVTSNLLLKAAYVGNAHTVAGGKLENVKTLIAEDGVTSELTVAGAKLDTRTGNTVLFTVAAEFNYTITGIAVVSAEGTNTVVEPTLRTKEVKADGLTYYTYAFTMPDENVVIDIYTEAKEYKVFVTEDDPANGTYTINGDTTTNKMIAQGEEVKIEAVPVNGYKVASIVAQYNDGTTFTDVKKVTDAEVLTFEMVPYEVEVIITYEAIDYVIDASTSNKETYKLDWNSDKMSFEEIENLDSAKTAKGYITIVGNTDCVIPVSATTSYKIPGDLEMANVGDEIQFTVTECIGYDLDELTVTYAGGTKTVPVTKNGDTYHFTMPASADVVITATFVEETYNVIKDEADEANGVVYINKLTETSVAADYKDEVTVKVIPDAGYYVKSISYVLDNTAVKDFDAASYTGTMTQDLDDTAHSIEFHMPASDVELTVEYGKIDYSITTNATNAAITVVDKATVGDEVTVTTKSNYGYIITSVYAEDENGIRLHMETDATSQIYGAEYRFTMPASPVKITVQTVEDEYNVKYLNDDGSFFAGERITYLKTANVAAHAEQIQVLKPGYHFVGWTSSDTQAAVTAPSTTDADFVIWQNTVIKANFEKDVIDVVIAEAANGTVTSGNVTDPGTVTSEYKATVEFTATPDKGYVIDEVIVTYVDDEGDDQVLPTRITAKNGNEVTYSIRVPATEKANVQDAKASDVTVTVTFKKAQFTLSKDAACETNGTIAVNGKVTTETTFTYDYQEQVLITATPNVGYYVTSIVATADDGTVMGSYTGTEPEINTLAGNSAKVEFLMPAQNVTYNVTYGMINYGITTVADETKGSVETNPAEKTTMGTLVTATVTPKPGYKLDSITATYEGGNKSCVLTQIADDQFTFNMPATKDNVVVEAIFTEITYTANLSVTGEGECTLNGYYTDNMYADYLDTVTVNVTPADGWKLVSITVDGGKVAVNEEIKPEGGDYTFTMPHNDVLVEVVLEKIDYTITTVANAVHGDLVTDPAGTGVVGEIVTAVVTPKPGYKLESIYATYDNGKKSLLLTQVGEDEFTFTMPAADVTVTAVFSEITYVANLAVSGEGLVTLNGFHTDNMAADYLDTVTVNVAPAAGWQLDSITVDGGKVAVNEEINPEGGDYTFVMPEKDVIVEVKMSKIGYDLESFAINFYEMGHGTVTLAPADVAYVDDKVIISADPDDGYRLKNVTVTDAEGNAVPVSFVSSDAYYTEVWSFTMPASAVDVVVIFEVDASSYYTDVRTDHWFYDAVTYVTDRGYFKGVSEDLFGPYIIMNRAMFVTVLGRLDGVDTTGYTTLAFSDVEAGSYYAPYVAWAAQNGIVLGRNETTFDPMGNITREEMVAIMYRYCKYLGMDVTPVNGVFMDRYTDTSEISDYAVECVEWAVDVGLIRGRSETTIDPKDLASRAEVAQIIKNFCDKVIAP